MKPAAWIVVAALAAAGASAAAPSSTAPRAATKPPGWAKFADCAAYYRINARIVDPSRPAAMAAQMGEVGGDYARAAELRYAQQKKAPPAAARHAIDARIAAGIERFGARPPRKALERLIDKCPQIGG